MKTLNFLPALLVLSLLFGCISLQYDHKIERSGDSVLSMSANISVLAGMVGGVGGNETDFNQQQTEACLEKEAADPKLQCEYADGVMTLTRPLSLNEGYYEFETEQDWATVRYTFTLEQLPDIDPTESDVSAGTGSAGIEDLTLKFTDPQAAENVDQMRQMLSAKYIVEMPGTVVSAEGAEMVEGSSATFDILDMMENGQNIVVVSEEDNYMNLIMIGGGILVLIVVVILAATAFMRLRR
ncbi:hypothetical protein DRN67_02525 [Candidatus Micrarchaeota archaeon]|nr:MAG: hypothetical protein DRN67_02525 [Candidatus Micrarchaeota archaeon]